MKIRKEVKIGFTFALVIAIIIWGINFLRGKNIFTASKQYYAVFSNIGGLEESSVVSANGYNIGQVTDIVFSHGDVNRILVEISVDRQFKIPNNSIVEIYSTDFMGSKAVNLILGDSHKSAHENDTLKAKFDGDISVLVTKKLLPLKDKTENLIVSVDSVMSIIKNTFTPETQQNLRESIQSLELLITTQRLKVVQILDNLEEVTQNLKNNSKQINNTLSNISNFSDSLQQANVKTMLVNANKTISETNLLLGKLNKNEGSLGKLINEDSLYVSLEHALTDLDSVLIDLKRNPKRYVHFSVFGSSDKKSAKK